MRRPFAVLVFAVLVLIAFLLSACGALPGFTCNDPLGCVVIESGENLKIASLLTTSGPDQVYGLDALRGVEIAIADQGRLLGRNIELVQADDQCDAGAGEEAARRLAADPKIIGVIGATCSNASLPAAKILSEAGMVLISPSSTAPSLTDPATHQPGFLRVIYNDKIQGQAVAEFAFSVLGSSRMLTIHDGTPYPKELQAAACESLQQMGGACVAQIDLSQVADLASALQAASAENPDVIYFPLYTADGVTAIKAIFQVGLANAALISSDGLLSSDFLQKAYPFAEGMYFSGPALPQAPESFLQKYKSRYGEEPIAVYHLQGYDAANMLFYAIQRAAVTAGNRIYIPRQKLRQALYEMRNVKGLSTVITCSPTGDCAQQKIAIFQARNNNFTAIYP